MGKHPIRFNSVVTAFLLGVTFSSSAFAQETSLDDLYQELLTADETNHERIADRILDRLDKSGSATIDLLLRRGEEALEQGDFVAAAEHYTATIDHAPEFSAAYSGRAQAYFNLEMIGPALDDLRAALVLEPRHFNAMFGVGIIMEGLERPEDAREVYRAILEIYPLEPDTLEALERVNLQLEGQAL
ncbi:Tetratricopeptide repeat-containing protein [Cognatiyoonia koreensis]|uniref:Tetratricopeptide repeat-containing protein n=2 Tax=Cognatiyoonia koreensis TaxID=364200 RepID=A0A1I0NDF6_9RHOB|nr:Tetratricopeptide repeat-containing protein [Cognatiyoonia koreensis]